MLPTRREIILSAPVLPALAPAVAAEEPSATITQLVQRLEVLNAQRERLSDRHAVRLGAAMAAGGMYLAEVQGLDAEYEHLVRQVAATPARGIAEIRLKAKVTGWHNVFPSPDDLCPADALVRSLLQDLGVVE